MATGKTWDQLLADYDALIIEIRGIVDKMKNTPDAQERKEMNARMRELDAKGQPILEEMDQIIYASIQ